ncbi:MAG: hypothetical protein ACRCU0_03485 [Candidatus Rhabdochlamydia sp.]
MTISALDSVSQIDVRLDVSIPRYLDWTQRPSNIKQSISEAFDQLASKDASEWLYNGSKKYRICKVDEHALMKKIIQQASVTQKEFYVLDIGAGDFQWSKSLADYLEKQADIPKDIKVHIFGVRGEKYLGDRIVETDLCKIYNLGAFKIEELFTKFKEQELDIENKLDLAISKWCFCHLVDPVGTLTQTYNLLRPKTGFLLMDGFMFLEEKDDLLDTDYNNRLIQLFLNITAPFLTQFHSFSSDLNHFILQRSDSTSCQLPMTYLDTVEAIDYQNQSELVTRFRREPQQEDKEMFSELSDHNSLYGNKSLYNWLQTNGLFLERSTWESVQNITSSSKN